MQELGSDVNLYALVFGESVLNDAVCFLLLSSACKNSQYLYLWLTYLSPSLEWTDGNFSLQVCFWLWYDLFFLSHVFLAYVCASRQDNVISQKSCSSRRELFYDDSPVPWDLCWFNVIRLHFCSKFGCHMALKFMKFCRQQLCVLWILALHSCKI